MTYLHRFGFQRLLELFINLEYFQTISFVKSKNIHDVLREPVDSHWWCPGQGGAGRGRAGHCGEGRAGEAGRGRSGQGGAGRRGAGQQPVVSGAGWGSSRRCPGQGGAAAGGVGGRAGQQPVVSGAGRPPVSTFVLPFSYTGNFVALSGAASRAGSRNSTGPSCNHVTVLLAAETSTT